MEAIRQMCSQNLTSLEVHYSVLKAEHPTLALWLMDAPEDILTVFDEVHIFCGVLFFLLLPCGGARAVVGACALGSMYPHAYTPPFLTCRLPTHTPIHNLGGERGGPAALPALQEHAQGRHRARAHRGPRHRPLPPHAPPGEQDGRKSGGEDGCMLSM